MAGISDELRERITELLDCDPPWEGGAVTRKNCTVSGHSDKPVTDRPLHCGACVRVLQRAYRSLVMQMDRGGEWWHQVCDVLDEVLADGPESKGE